MNPKIENIKNADDVLTFTLSGVNVSLSNAIRRVILSDIKTVVFKTSPHEENKCTILSNTSRFHNEIIKQRLSCIPIHINDITMPLKNYRLEVNVENNTDTKIYVTTEDFKIKNIDTNTYLSKTDTVAIFPPNQYSNYYIDFLRLRPKISDEILGEKINLMCEFSIGTAKEDGMFNVASNCSYGFTPDNNKITEESKIKSHQLKEQGMNKDEIDFEIANWRLLDALRITKKDSYDFTIQSIGVFTNFELIEKACNIIIERLYLIKKMSESEDLKIERSQNTMNNCFDIILENEDYTIGKIVEFTFYHKYFEGLKTLSFCGFKKFHPHDTYSIVRLAYREPIDISIITQNISEVITDAINVYQKINAHFAKGKK